MRIVQLSGSSQHGWTLQKFAYVPIDQRLTQDSSDLGKKRLGEAIMGAVEQAGIKTKNIAVGLPANKTFTSIVETETLPEKELIPPAPRGNCGEPIVYMGKYEKIPSEMKFSGCQFG